MVAEAPVAKPRLPGWRPVEVIADWEKDISMSLTRNFIRLSMKATLLAGMAAGTLCLASVDPAVAQGKGSGGGSSSSGGDGGGGAGGSGDGGSGDGGSRDSGQQGSGGGSSTSGSTADDGERGGAPEAAGGGGSSDSGGRPEGTGGRPEDVGGGDENSDRPDWAGIARSLSCFTLKAGRSITRRSSGYGARKGYSSLGAIRGANGSTTRTVPSSA